MTVWGVTAWDVTVWGAALQVVVTHTHTIPISTQKHILGGWLHCRYHPECLKESREMVEELKSWECAECRFTSGVKKLRQEAVLTYVEKGDAYGDEVCGDEVCADDAWPNQW